MAVSRRNALIGLGAIVGGAGVFAATGAFTTVEAQRTVDIEAAGDEGALLEMTPHADSQLVDDEGDTIEFAIDNLNLRARTTFSAELVVTNNGANTVDVDILEEFGGASLVDSGGVIEFTINESESEALSSNTEDHNQGLLSGEGVVFGITIDFTDAAVDAVDSALSPLDDTTDVEPLLDQVLPEDFIVIEANESS